MRQIIKSTEKTKHPHHLTYIRCNAYSSSLKRQYQAPKIIWIDVNSKYCANHFTLRGISFLTSSQAASSGGYHLSRPLQI